MVYRLIWVIWEAHAPPSKSCRKKTKNLYVMMRNPYSMDSSGISKTNFKTLICLRPIPEQKPVYILGFPTPLYRIREAISENHGD